MSWWPAQELLMDPVQLLVPYGLDLSLQERDVLSLTANTRLKKPLALAPIYTLQPRNLANPRKLRGIASQVAWDTTQVARDHLANLPTNAPTHPSKLQE